jgi:N-acetylglutamate synthase-like GNAT family acetyltransferase
VASHVAAADPAEAGSADCLAVRRARLADAEAIAAFVNATRSDARAGARSQLSPQDVAQRFGQVGFMVAECRGRLVGLLGWQVENLVVRATDLLVAYERDPAAVGQALVARMEADGAELLAEAAIVLLPRRASKALVAFWRDLGYERQHLEDLPSAWQEAVIEYGLEVQSVMLKRLRRDLIRRPV